MKLLRKTVLFCLSLGSNLDSPGSIRFEFTYELLYKLVGFAPVSIRGAVIGLKEEAAVSVYTREGLARIQLTSVGTELLKASFPALTGTNAKKERVWTVCVFVDAISEVGKKKGRVSLFRSVRSELLRQGFFPLERGVYVLPSAVSPDLTAQLSRLHMLHRVLIFETRKMVVGDERAIVRSLFDIKTMTKEAESLERTLSGLNRRLAQKEKLPFQTRELFTNLIPRLMAYFSLEQIVPDVYFPQELRLSDIKRLVTDVSTQILPKI